jgi:hypothetical protein
MKANALSATREEIPSPVCCQNDFAVGQCVLSNNKIWSSMQSTPVAAVAADCEDEATSGAGVEGREIDGQMTNSTMREGRGGDWLARKSRASVATRGEGRRMQSSSGRPNFARHRPASWHIKSATIISKTEGIPKARGIAVTTSRLDSLFGYSCG